MVWDGVLILVLVMVLVLCAAALDRLHVPRPRPADLPRHQGGTATLEFALLLPIALFVILMLTQVTLMMAGRYFVHYAAYAATRSAVTAIPADYAPDEPRNVIDIAEGSTKLGKIRQAAVYAVMPAGGRLQATSAVPSDALTAGLEAHYAAYGRNVPRWVSTLAADRLRYANANTRVVLMRVEVDGDDMRFVDLGEGSHYFGPRQAVSVRVEHRLNLSVPYVRGVFADGRHDSSTGQGAYANVQAQHTLINHGIVPSLPPPPSLPRLDPRREG